MHAAQIVVNEIANFKTIWVYTKIDKKTGLTLMKHTHDRNLLGFQDQTMRLL